MAKNICTVRPVTIEGQTFEILKDTNQTFCLDGRLWAQLCTICLGTFQFSGKKNISRGDLGQHLLEKSEKFMAGLGLDAA